MDSRPSGLAMRASPAAKRSVNILAARGASKRATDRQAAISFTQRFVTACLDDLRFGSTGVLDFATVVTLFCQEKSAGQAVSEVGLVNPISLRVWKLYSEAISRTVPTPAKETLPTSLR
jgi:hypothetical protein